MNNVSRNNRSVLISDEDTEVFKIVNIVSISSVICLFGIVTNVMNMVVFYKQGFTSTINISFFGLAISDLCSLISMLWLGTCLNPLFVHSDVPMLTVDVQHLTAGMPHICFARITSWITVFIAAERCLCIMVPLKIKQIITPRRTTIILCAIYLVIMISFLPEYELFYLGWKFSPERNKTLIGLVFTVHKDKLEGLVFFFYAILGLTSFVAVIVFTVVLIVQLKHKSKWRSTASTDKTVSESINNRDRKTVTMVVMIATVLIVCYAPGVAVSLVTFFKPEFSISGLNTNIFFAVWSFVFILEDINSSINIFLYYKMSSKYRETFNRLFSIGDTTDGRPLTAVER